MVRSSLHDRGDAVSNLGKQSLVNCIRTKAPDSVIGILIDSQLRGISDGEKNGKRVRIISIPGTYVDRNPTITTLKG